MKHIFTISILVFLIGCGNKDSDTGDTANSSDTNDEFVE